MEEKELQSRLEELMKRMEAVEDENKSLRAENHTFKINQTANEMIAHNKVNPVKKQDLIELLEENYAHTIKVIDKLISFPTLQTGKKSTQLIETALKS